MTSKIDSSFRHVDRLVVPWIHELYSHDYIWFKQGLVTGKITGGWKHEQETINYILEGVSPQKACDIFFRGS